MPQLELLAEAVDRDRREVARVGMQCMQAVVASCISKEGGQYYDKVHKSLKDK